jgi:hypothetical protein
LALSRRRRPLTGHRLDVAFSARLCRPSVWLRRRLTSSSSGSCTASCPRPPPAAAPVGDRAQATSGRRRSRSTFSRHSRAHGSSSIKSRQPALPSCSFRPGSSSQPPRPLVPIGRSGPVGSSRSRPSVRGKLLRPAPVGRPPPRARRTLHRRRHSHGGSASTGGPRAPLCRRRGSTPVLVTTTTTVFRSLLQAPSLRTRFGSRGVCPGLVRAISPLAR